MPTGLKGIVGVPGFRIRPKRKRAKGSIRAAVQT